MGFVGGRQSGKHVPTHREEFPEKQSLCGALGRSPRQDHAHHCVTATVRAAELVVVTVHLGLGPLPEWLPLAGQGREDRHPQAQRIHTLHCPPPLSPGSPPPTGISLVWCRAYPAGSQAGPLERGGLLPVSEAQDRLGRWGVPPLPPRSWSHDASQMSAGNGQSPAGLWDGAQGDV